MGALFVHRKLQSAEFSRHAGKWHFGINKKTTSVIGDDPLSSATALRARAQVERAMLFSIIRFSIVVIMVMVMF